MRFKTIGLAAMLAVAGAGLGGCASDYYGGGPGYYDSYYDGYGGYYDDGGLYYAPSYYGWYGDYYYPGVGGYVYDRNHVGHRWDHRQENYWHHRGGEWHGDRPNGGNWDRFGHRPAPGHFGGGQPGGQFGAGHFGGGHSGGHGHH